MLNSKKYVGYLKYILEHKWFVLQECWKEGLYWQGVTHDLSKFHPSEFFPYASFFFGTPEEKEMCER